MNQPSEHPFLGGTPPDDALLLAYAEGRLSPKVAHAVEEWLATETPEADAIEGLQLLPQGEVRALQQRINSRIAHTTKRSRRERRRQPLSQRWILTAVALLLLLLVVAVLYFFVFRG